jgi:glucose-6-phosphate 1-dehydrogenase
VVAPVLDNPPAPEDYPAGSWGPQPAVDALIAPRPWHLQSTTH